MNFNLDSDHLPVVPMDVAMARLAVVESCPYRGEVIPTTCCEGRHHCSANFGSEPWTATLVECLFCATLRKVPGWPVMMQPKDVAEALGTPIVDAAEMKTAGDCGCGTEI